MSTLQQTVGAVLRTFDNFTARAAGMKMYFYQLEPAKAIIESITKKLGLTIVIVISRQAGKDELLANLLTYLMTLFSHKEVGIVVANPTYKPQTTNFIVRLESRLKRNLLTRTVWKKRSDYMRIIGSAIVSLLSGDKDANVVGAVASLLLVVNEAQDISTSKYDKDFAPMVASTNATRVIVGTEWTNDTLLAREIDAARQLEKADGIKRVFVYTADQVRTVNEAYGQFVDSEVQKKGRQHPLVKTQYFCERIDAITGMFPARRLALIQGDQPPQTLPTLGHIYAFLIDVAGQDEAAMQLDGMNNPGRDKTTVDIIDVDLSALDLLQSPIYRVVQRFEWHGTNHVDIYGGISSMVDLWQPLWIIEDATGAGEGLWGMLYKAYPSRTIGFKYTSVSKSELGYGFLAIVESGRFRDCVHSEEVRMQYHKCKSEILQGPGKTMRWGVPEGTRDENGLLVHDDYLTTDALTAQLDLLEWYIPFESFFIEQPDPLEGMNNAY